MGITYNKSKDRLILPRGPRDLQRRQLQETNVGEAQSELLESLRDQIKLLQEQLDSSAVSDKELNDDIAEVIKKETAKHRKRIDKLENENDKLNAAIQNSDVLIEQLKQIKTIPVTNQYDTVSDRPKIEEAFIDPIEKEFDGIESHIKTEETIGLDKKDMLDKADKLKKLLGKV